MPRMTPRPDSGSFRDPSGHVVVESGRVLRWVNASYRPHYDAFHDSEASRLLRERRLLVGYREIEPVPEGAYRLLETEKIPFVSYPYEWSFGQLQAAALLTLDIQLLLLEHGFTLKDATPFNVQFLGTRPVFIDLLSFEVLEPGRPWQAYRQFCESFLAPLLLMAHVDLDLGRLLQIHLDGIPLALCSALLPLSAKVRPKTYLHLVLHARLGASQRTDREPKAPRPVDTASLAVIARQLRSLIAALEPRSDDSLWTEYYESHLNYTDEGIRHKKEVVETALNELRPHTVWDLGCNVGLFSRICAEAGAAVVAFDSDPSCVERLFRRLREEQEERILPLRLDLANPSPALGWDNRERRSLLDRGAADLVLALGLTHHLRLTHNVPFAMQADFLSRCGSHLLVEYVGPDDEMVKRLARHKESLLADYSEASFLAAFEGHFSLGRRVAVADSQRVLFLLAATPRRD